MNVLIIAEDYRHDQYILKPLVQAMMNSIGRPATVQVCRDPMLRGLPDVRDRDKIEEVIHTNPMADLYLLAVDRDGEEVRHAQLEGIEDYAQGLLVPGAAFLSECARQEVEVWLLAGHNDLPNEWSWRDDVRPAPDPKEQYYEPYAERRGVLDGPGTGRKRLGKEAARRYDRICQLCEEVRALEHRIENWWGERA